jgi:hypothetical protein
MQNQQIKGAKGIKIHSGLMQMKEYLQSLRVFYPKDARIFYLPRLIINVQEAGQ